MRDGLDRWADPPLLVLASLAEEPRHGYAITQDIADTMGVRLSAGTLYAVISRLESRGLIEPLESDDRRRPYRLTAEGARELAEQSERMQQVASVAQRRLRANYGRAGAGAPRSRRGKAEEASWSGRRLACTRPRGGPVTEPRSGRCSTIPVAAHGRRPVWPGTRPPRGPGRHGTCRTGRGGCVPAWRRPASPGRCWPAWEPSSCS